MINPVETFNGKYEKKQVVDFGGNNFGHNESGFCGYIIYLSLH